MTKRLEAELLAKGFNPQEFCQYFKDWKEDGPGAEDWFFGKDNFYSKPTKGGKMVLQHVHLAPGETDTDETGSRVEFHGAGTDLNSDWRQFCTNRRSRTSS